MRRDDWYWDRYFPPSVPLEAKGGIKAQSKRGGFASSWWAKRWIAVLESFDIGARLGRGRSYARRGQVLNLEIAKGRVTASVQGSRPKPYEVSIEVKTLNAAEWGKTAATLKGQALYAAKLLGGEMPAEIEAVFHQAGASLFPERSRDLETECSCPDWSNPCKHIAAVYYLLGEEFDRDPFLIFKLRGMERGEFMDLLGAAAAAAPAVSREKPEPLAADPTAFWNAGAPPEDFGELESPPVAAALAKRLGKFPLWRGERRLTEALEPVYRAASVAALALRAGAGGWGPGAGE